MRVNGIKFTLYYVSVGPVKCKKNENSISDLVSEYLVMHGEGV
jgi:hypothetical protein